MNPKVWMVCGSLLAATGVALGAYHAHGLEESLARDELDAEQLGQRMSQFETAVHYQMYHALALVLIGTRAAQANRRAMHVAGAAFLLGIVLFSGMLYLFALTGQQLHALLIPLGGASYIAGWCTLAVAGGPPGRGRGEHDE